MISPTFAVETSLKTSTLRVTIWCVKNFLNTLAAACITGDTLSMEKCITGDTRDSQRVK